jgi:hypothetical protein
VRTLDGNAGWIGSLQVEAAAGDNRQTRFMRDPLQRVKAAKVVGMCRIDHVGDSFLPGAARFIDHQIAIVGEVLCRSLRVEGEVFVKKNRALRQRRYRNVPPSTVRTTAAPGSAAALPGRRRDAKGVSPEIKS